jgi:hypothetical protein
MFDACTSPEDRAIPAETGAERRLRRLSRMADIGLSIAEKLERQAELAAIHAEVDAVPDNLPHSRRLDEIGRTFAQVSRAVSLATALEDRIDKGLAALPDDDRAVREREARDKRAEVAKAVVRAIDSDPSVHSRRRVVQLRLNLDRLLDAELRDLDRFLRRPFPEIEIRLRRDLGLEPDADDAVDDPGVLGARASSPRRGPWGQPEQEARAPENPARRAATRAPSGASP